MSITTIEKSIFINANRDTVWSFLTNKDKLGEWYHPAEESLKEGEDYVLLARNDDGSTRPQVWGKVVKMLKPSFLVTTFNIPPFNGVETTVKWTLSEVAGGTRLQLVHEGIAEASGEAALQLLMALDAGWDNHLSKLRSNVR